MKYRYGLDKKTTRGSVGEFFVDQWDKSSPIRGEWYTGGFLVKLLRSFPRRRRNVEGDELLISVEEAAGNAERSLFHF
jgi:hypothetical protein